MDTATLWSQILAAPGDENLKTRYIQAMQQAGDPRAEIFRLVEELQKFPSYYVQHEELSRRYKSSLENWSRDFDTPAKTWQAEVTFIQGWPLQITIAAHDFLHHADEIVARLPLRHVNLTAIDEAPEVFALAPFGQIASLDGSQQSWSSEAINALASSKHLSALRWLDLSHSTITEAQVDILAASQHLKELAHVDLRNNPCRDPVDAATGYGVDWESNSILAESIRLPEFGRELEGRYGTIGWLHALEHFMEQHPPGRYLF